MKCPFCLKSGTFVKDSRDTEEGLSIRRRRQCDECGGRFTTFEKIQLRELIVIKKSGAKRPFDRDKIYKSISTALRKRKISLDEVNNITSKIVLELQNSSSREISSRKIGELIIQELAKIDQVAYIRFASVYKDFNSAQDFLKFVSKIKP